MRIPRVRLSVRMMMVAVGVMGIASAVGARMKRDNEAALRHLLFNATLNAQTELGDLSTFDVTSQRTGDYSARVDFRPKDVKRQNEGRSYQVDSCSCGLKMKVTSSPLP